MSDMGNFDFVMSLRLETEKATEDVHDMWQVLRDMSSQSIALELDANADFTRVKSELKALKDEAQAAIKSFEAMEKAQKESATELEAQFEKLSQAAPVAADRIRRAFKDLGLDGAQRQIAQVREEFVKETNYTGRMTDAGARRTERARRIVEPILNRGAAARDLFREKEDDAIDMVDHVSRLRTATRNLEKRRDELTKVMQDQKEVLEGMKAKGIEETSAQFRKTADSFAEARGRLEEAIADDEQHVAQNKAIFDKFRKNYGERVDDLFATADALEQVEDFISASSKKLRVLAGERDSQAKQGLDTSDIEKEIAETADLLEYIKKFSTNLELGAKKLDELMDKFPDADQVRKRLDPANEIQRRIAIFDSILDDSVAAMAAETNASVSASDLKRVKDNTMNTYRNLHKQVSASYIEAAAQALAPGMQGGNHLKNMLNNLLGGLGGGGMIGQVLTQAMAQGGHAAAAVGNVQIQNPLQGADLNIDLSQARGELAELNNILREVRESIEVLKSFKTKTFTVTPKIEGLDNLREISTMLTRLDRMTATPRVGLFTDNFWQDWDTVMGRISTMDKQTISIPVELMEGKAVEEAQVLRSRIQEQLRGVTASLDTAMEGQVYDINVRADASVLRNSILAVLNGPWPDLEVRVHEPILKTSIEQALSRGARAFEEDEASIIRMLFDVDDLKKTKLPEMKILLDRDFLVQQIGEAVRQAEGLFAIKVGAETASQFIAANKIIAAAGSAELKTAQADLAKARADKIRSTTKTEADKDAEEEVRKQKKAQRARQDEVERAEKVRRQAEGKSNDGIDTLSRYGILNRDMLESVRDAISAQGPGKGNRLSDAAKLREEVVKQYTDKLKDEKVGNDDVDRLRSAWEQFDKLFTRINAILREDQKREAQKNLTKQRNDDAMAAYNSEVVTRMAANLSAFRDIYKMFDNTPLDRYKDRVDAYKRVYGEVRKYERELIGYTLARDEKEIQMADRRITAARRSVELAQDELNIRLLANREKVNMRTVQNGMRLDDMGRVVPQASFVKDADGNYRRNDVSEIRAYKETNALLRQEFGPALDGFNAAVTERQKELLADARAAENSRKREERAQADGLYAQAEGLKQVDMRNYIGRLRGESGSADEQAIAQDQFRRSMALDSQEQRMLERAQKRGTQEQMINALMQRRIGLLSEEVAIQDRLQAKIVKQRQEMELLQRYDALRQQRPQDSFGLRQAARGLSHSMGGFALGIGAGYYAVDSVRQFAQYEQEIANIRGVLSSKSQYDADRIGESIGTVSQQYGAPLLETAKAAKTLAQAGLNAQEVMKELNFTMMGMRGMGMTIEQMNELQLAVRAVSKEAVSTSSILERISRIESQYAVSSQELADAIKLSSPFLENFTEGMRGMGDVFDESIAITTVMKEQVRSASGSQIGNAQKFIFARLLRPEVGAKLQEDFGLKLGREDGKGLLPLNELLKEIMDRYNQLKNGGEDLKANQMLSQIAGAHRVNYLAALLNNQDDYRAVRKESSYAFGEAEERSAIAMDTLSAKAQQARNSLQLFVNNMLQGTLVADGFKAALWSVSQIMGGINGTGAGTGTLFGLIAGGFGAVQATRSVYENLEMRRDARHLGVGYDRLNQAESSRRKERIAQRRGIPLSDLESGDDGFEVDQMGNLVMGPDGNPVRKSGAAGPRGRLRTDYRGGMAGATQFKLAQAGDKVVGGLARGLGGLVSLVGPTGVIALGILGVTALAGGMYRVITRAQKETDEFRIKLKTADQLRVWESPQFQEMDRMSQQYGLDNARVGYRKMATTLLDDPNINAVAKKYGATDLDMLANMSRKGMLGDRAPNVATDIINAFVASESMPEEFRKKLSEVKTEAERVAIATKLIGEAAWAANYQMTMAINQLRDSTTRMIETTLQGLDQINTSKRTGIQKYLRPLLDVASLTTTLDGMATGTMYGLDREALPVAQSKANFTVKEALKDANMPLTLLNSLTGAGGIFDDAVNSVIKGFVAAGKTSATTAEIIAEAGKLVDGEWNRKFTITEWTRDKDGKAVTQTRETTNGREFTVDRMSKAMLGLAGYEEQVRALDPNFSLDAFAPKTDQAISWISGMLDEAKIRAESQGRLINEDGQPGATRIANIDELVGATKHVALALDAGVEAMSKFKDKLLDLVLSLYTETAKLDSEKRFASQFGLAFNEAGQRMELARNFWGQFDQFDELARVDVLRAKNDLANLNAGNFKATRTGANGETEEFDVSAAQILSGGADSDVTKQFTDRKRQLEAQLQAYDQQLTKIEAGKFSIANLLPAGKERDEVLRFLDQQFAMARQGQITGEELTNNIRDRLGLYYEQNRAIEFQRRLALQMSQLELQRVERTAEVGKISLDLITDLAQRTRAREEIEWSIMDAKYAQLRVQLEQGDLDDDEYALKVAELEAQTNLTLEIERMQQYEKSVVELRQKGLANLNEAASGLKDVLSDNTMWGDLVRKGADHGEAAGKILKSILDPIGNVWNKNVVDQVMGMITESLSKNDTVRKMFEGPEVKMQNAVAAGGTLAAQDIYRSLDLSGDRLANKIRAAIEGAVVQVNVGGAKTDGAVTPPGAPGGTQPVSPNNGPLQNPSYQTVAGQYLARGLKPYQMAAMGGGVAEGIAAQDARMRAMGLDPNNPQHANLYSQVEMDAALGRLQGPGQPGAPADTGPNPRRRLFAHIPDKDLTPDQIAQIHASDPRIAGEGRLYVSEKSGKLVYDSPTPDVNFLGRPIISGRTGRQSRPTHSYEMLHQFVRDGEKVSAAERRVLSEGGMSDRLNRDLNREVRSLDAMDPEARPKMEAFLERLRQEGMRVRINETYRSPERQRYLFRQSRAHANVVNPTAPTAASTWTLTSDHMDRRAIDIVLNGDTSGGSKAYERAWALAAEYGVTAFGKGDAGHFAVQPPAPVVPAFDPNTLPKPPQIRGGVRPDAANMRNNPGGHRATARPQAAPRDQVDARSRFGEIVMDLPTPFGLGVGAISTALTGYTDIYGMLTGQDRNPGSLVTEGLNLPGTVRSLNALNVPFTMFREAALGAGDDYGVKLAHAQGNVLTFNRDVPYQQDPHKIGSTAVHEVAHVFDNFNLDRDLERRIKSQYERGRALDPDAYAATNRVEYFAEVIREAHEFLNYEGDKQRELQTVEELARMNNERIPGVSDAVGWLLSKPEFRDHPFAKAPGRPGFSLTPNAGPRAGHPSAGRSVSLEPKSFSFPDISGTIAPVSAAVRGWFSSPSMANPSAQRDTVPTATARRPSEIRALAPSLGYTMGNVWEDMTSGFALPDLPNPVSLVVGAWESATSGQKTGQALPNPITTVTDAYAAGTAQARRNRTAPRVQATKPKPTPPAPARRPDEIRALPPSPGYLWDSLTIGVSSWWNRLTGEDNPATATGRTRGRPQTSRPGRRSGAARSTGAARTPARVPATRSTANTQQAARLAEAQARLRRATANRSRIAAKPGATLAERQAAGREFEAAQANLRSVQGGGHSVPHNTVPRAGVLGGDMPLFGESDPMGIRGIGREIRTDQPFKPVRAPANVTPAATTRRREAAAATAPVANAVQRQAAVVQADTGKPAEVVIRTPDGTSLNPISVAGQQARVPQIGMALDPIVAVGEPELKMPNTTPIGTQTVTMGRSGAAARKGRWGVGADGQISAGGQVAMMAGSYVGNIGGNLLGGGGQWASTGSNFGSSAGGIVGMAVGGPMGAAIGSALGGIAGGLFGGLFDDDKPEKAINHLDSIEFNTRENVTAIEQMGDKLRGLDSMLMNLPTNFTKPGYMPQFAGGNGSGGAAVTGVTPALDQSTSVSFAPGAIVVQGNGNVADIQVAVEKAVAKAINVGRSTTTRKSSGY